MYVAAFKHETGISAGTALKDCALLEQAIPKDWADLEKKMGGKPFYRSNAEIFLRQVDVVLEYCSVYSLPDDLHRQHQTIKELFADSIAFLNDWGSSTQGVPDVYDVWGPGVDHFHQVYNAARGQSRGESGRSTYSTVSLLRTAIELRLRWAFGVLGRVNDQGGIGPVGLSKLLEEIRKHKDEITFAVPFEHIVRVYGWCNLYMHSGMKLYRWSPRFALDYLQPMFDLCEYGNGGKGLNASIQAPKAVFDSIRAALDTTPKEVEGSDVILVTESRCQIILT